MTRMGKNERMKEGMEIGERRRELTWELRLFVARRGPSTERTVAALEQICQLHLAEHFRIELIDVEAQPEQADEFDIIATPTLVRVSPTPERRVVGDLTRPDEVLLGLELPFKQGV